jgi:polygalacturonase
LNQALGYAGVIRLKPGVVYDIQDSLLFRSDTTIEGNGVILKLAKGLSPWGYRGCPIRDEKAMLMISNNFAKNIKIKDVTVDGSQSDYYPDVRLGTNLFNMATMIGVDNITIENCLFKNGCNDALMFSKSSNIIIDGLTVDKCGHDGVATFYVEDISVKNSTFINRTNSSCRFYNVTKGVFENNKCSTSGGGHTGLQLQGTLKDIHASGNYIKGLPYPGIRSLDARMTNVVIEDNLIEKCRSPGIDAPGAILRNNKISY